jgi:hypothetical protein
VSNPTAQPAPAPAIPSAPGDKPSPLAEAPKPEAEGVLTNQSVLELAGAHVPESVIVSQIRASKTKFDLSTAGIIQLTKGGVAPAVIEAMRHPRAVNAVHAGTRAVSAAKRVGTAARRHSFRDHAAGRVPINPAPGTALHSGSRGLPCGRRVAIAKERQSRARSTARQEEHSGTRGKTGLPPTD